MSDLKMVCPACDSWTSSVGIAFRDGEPCPYCGLPADTARVVIEARARRADEDLVARVLEADQRAVKAEAEAAVLRARLNEVRRAVAE